MHRILVVEDSPDARELIRSALSGDYEVHLAENLVEARRHLDHDLPDLVLLDLRLPDGNGHELCAELQARAGTREIPVVFLSACSDTPSKVMAFSLGAEDYVEKPFVPEELRARIGGRLRRQAVREQQLVTWGPLCLDPSRFRATLSSSEGVRALELTPHELHLLLELTRRRGALASRSELRAAVWGRTAISERTLNTHVSNLRRKLGDGAPRIESVRGVGYRLRWPV